MTLLSDLPTEEARPTGANVQILQARAMDKVDEWRAFKLREVGIDATSW